MDRRADWPWSWEEEAEWKAELEERDDDFLEELIDNAGDSTNDSQYVLEPGQEKESSEDSTPEKYSVVA
jgi:hypothetical protein